MEKMESLEMEGGDGEAGRPGGSTGRAKGAFDGDMCVRCACKRMVV
jgi:hypothetical protein